jgi:endonuclease YncB( thermonuclease family)
MASDQRWRWAGIASVIGIGGVLITDIVANVVGGYISDQIKDWQVPGQQPGVSAATPSQTEAMVVGVPNAAPKTNLATVVAKPQPIEPERIEPVASRDALPRDLGPEPGVAPLPEPQSLPAPPTQPMVLNGTVEKVIDTGTLKIGGETVLLAGVKGLGSPYRDQLEKFIEEQGSQVRCMPSGVRHTCYVSDVDLALAALTNGAARLGEGASDKYRQAAEEAQRNHRGIFQ